MTSAPAHARKSYEEFLRSKIPQAEVCGFEPPSAPHPSLFPHQVDIASWMIRGGRRACFANFGLGKTRIDLQLAQWVTEKTGGRFLIIAPLGVRQEFTLSDGPSMGLTIEYVRDDAEVQASTSRILITNYERVRDGGIDLDQFDGVSMDEASVLRSYGSKTYQSALRWGRKVKYRFVFTATPSPNRYKELIHYSAFLGVMDSGDALTRFFQRDSEEAGNLTLYPHMEATFWAWMSSWAVFMQKPSDLGHSDEGYDMPPMRVHWHRVDVDHTAAWSQVDSWGQAQLFQDEAAGLAKSAEVKRESIALRVSKARELIDSEPMGKHWIIWHDLEAERAAIEDEFPLAKTVYGSQDLDEREGLIMGFSRGEYRILATKPSIAGSGCNFQRHCADAVFLGVGYKFNDFIQAIHRIHRFQQKRTVNIHIVYLESEDAIVIALKAKWKRHNDLMDTMSEILRKNKLSNLSVMELIRSLGCERAEVKSKLFTVIRNDVIMELMPIDLGHNDRQHRHHDTSSIQVARSSQRGEEGLRPRVQGEESGKEASECSRLVSQEQRDVDREGRSQQPEEPGAAIEVTAKVRDSSSREDCGENTGMVPGEQGACLGAGSRRRIEEAVRYIPEEVSGTPDKSGREVCHLRNERDDKETPPSGSLPQNGQGSGDLVLPLQHGPRSVLGQPGASPEGASVSREAWPDNCVDFICTSIPFGNQYEYSPNYSDLGHNPSNSEFFKQLAFLTPNLLRILRPGRIAAIHVKDRIRFGNVTGDGFPTVDPFSDHAVTAFCKAGFRLMARITIDTDVVRENNQTYRLGWSENAKDSSKMGAGMPEYVLVFRKLPSDTSDGYADIPVKKSKAEYTRADWQIDAAGIWRSSGNRLPDAEVLRHMSHPELIELWKAHCAAGIYSHEEHVAVAKSLEEYGHLPATFMLFASLSRNSDVWSDIARMLTLNTKQSAAGREKHVCPLQLDIIKRLITRYTNRGELVFDPFMGIGSVGYQAIKMGRRAIGTELNEDYWRDSVGYMEMAERDISMPTLFDFADAGAVEIGGAA